VVTSDKEEDLDILGEMLDIGDVQALVNRPNREGEAALELASQTNSPPTLMLWAAGAKPSRDQWFKAALMEQAGLQAFGLQHVIECPELASVDINAKRVVEQKIEDLFQVVFVPTFGLNEEKKKELRKFSREWNKDHNVKVMPTDSSIGGEGTWSDRDIAEGRKLGILAIRDPRSASRYIGTMHCNDVWTDWRTTGYGAADKEEETLDLATGEDITSISGCSDDYDGSTYSLQAETSSGRQWGPYGNHSGSLRLSPPTSSGLKLHHLSGDQSRGSWIIRLHWEMDQK